MNATKISNLSCFIINLHAHIFSSKAQKNQQQKLEDALQEEDYDFGGREAVVPAEEGEGEEGDGLLAAETRNL